MGTCVASNSRKNNEQENVELEMRKYIRKGMVLSKLTFKMFSSPKSI